MLDAPPIVVNVPTNTGSLVSIELRPQIPVVVVGPNGSGKSALSGYLQTRLGSTVNRIFAHRRLWLNSSAPEIGPAQLHDYVPNFTSWDNSIESRWRDHADSIRVSAIIQDVLDRQNGVNAKIANRVRETNDATGMDLDGPLELLNGILKESALSVKVEVSSSGELASVNTEEISYPAAEMSDGEKAALLLISDVLVADEGSVHLVDEPERHLHRSISASLINSLINLRKKDRFVVFTHDLDLAATLGLTGKTFVTKSCH